MNNEHQDDARVYDEYAFNVTPQPLVKYLGNRLKRNKRDNIDNLTRRLIADRRIPRQGSLSMYRAQLSSKKYSAEDLATFERAWQEMKLAEIGE